MSKEPQQISSEIKSLIADRKLGYAYNNNPVPEYFFKNIDKAKELIKSCFLEFDPEFKRPDKKFIWLPEYDLVAKWMVNTQGRGLVLTGECGTGKSTILKHVIPLCYATKQKLVLPVSCYDLSDPAAKLYNRAVEKGDNNLVFHEVKKLRHLLLDEVGKELNIMLSYTEKFNPVEVLINLSEDENKALFMTTNLSLDETAKKYGDRSFDRITKRCFVIQFKSESLR